jgi:hypothetical protein
MLLLFVPTSDFKTSTEVKLKPNQIKKSEMGGAYSMYGERNGTVKVLVGISEGNTWKIRKDNIKMDLQEVG